MRATCFLASTCVRRKSKTVQANLIELGEENLEERLKGSIATPAYPPYRVTNLIAETVPQVSLSCRGCREDNLCATKRWHISHLRVAQSWCTRSPALAAWIAPP